MLKQKGRLTRIWSNSITASLALGLMATSFISTPTVSAESNLPASYRHQDGLLLPDPKVTPGEVRALSPAQVCATKWGLDVRHVTLAMKKRVCHLYGAESCPGPEWEIDHLVPRELAGADVIKNLFPQPIKQARLKDRLENAYRRDVCAGRLTLTDAQERFRANWVAAYRERFK